jgi:hypothetical protein
VRRGNIRMTQPTINTETPRSAERLGGDVESDVHKELAAINTRINDIVAFQQRKRAWYRDTSLMIAGAAFFISLVTSGISAYRTHKQDINSRKDALHGIIQQYYTTMLSNTATQFSFQKDLTGPTDPRYSATQIYSNAANQIVGSANVAYAKQALSLVDELGGNASAIDFVETGTLLGAVNQIASAEELYRRAMPVSVNSIEYVAAARALAQQQYYLGKRDEATVTMKNALDVFSKFPNEVTYSSDYVNYTHAQTYVWWAGFTSTRDCKLSKENISHAEYYAGLLTPVVHQTSGIDGQISAARNALASCDTAAR